MGISIEFYSAESEAFVVAVNDETAEAFEGLDPFPRADFSLHLRWPDDMDRLCQALRTEGLNVPGSLDELLVEEVCSDGISCWGYRVADTLARAVAPLSDAQITLIAKRWITSFVAPDMAHYSDALVNGERALTELRAASADALAHGRPLMLLVIG